MGEFNSTEAMMCISIKDFAELVRTAERVETLKRIASRNKYIPVHELKEILNIEIEEEEEIFK